MNKRVFKVEPLGLTSCSFNLLLHIDFWLWPKLSFGFLDKDELTRGLLCRWASNPTKDMQGMGSPSDSFGEFMRKKEKVKIRNKFNSK